MVVINALVYKDEEDGRICVQDGGPALLSDGKTEEEAKKLYLELLELQLDTAREYKAQFLVSGKVSERYKKGLEEIYLSEEDIKPDIRKTHNIEVHFYNELID